MTAVSIYRARKGARISDEQAARYGPRLTQLAGATGGYVCAEAVVADAADPGSPLHDFFEWDDTEAARQHRLSQAREVCRSVVFHVIKPDSPEPQEIRALHFVKEAAGYAPLLTVMRKPRHLAAIIAHALREAEGWAERYRVYQELRPMSEAICKLVAQIRASQG